MVRIENLPKAITPESSVYVNCGRSSDSSLFLTLPILKDSGLLKRFFPEQPEGIYSSGNCSGFTPDSLLIPFFKKEYVTENQVKIMIKFLSGLLIFLIFLNGMVPLIPHGFPTH
tara:strand:- start:713 stop:1054 length:342 start_codon:yes stop_codon:yes gene_type:complete